MKEEVIILVEYNVIVFDINSKLNFRTTQANGELLDTLDDDSLTNSKFNPNHPTKIVVHGFGGGRNLSPSTDMRNAYFTRGNYNVIIVDYGTLVKEPCLSQVSLFYFSCGFKMTDNKVQ